MLFVGIDVGLNGGIVVLNKYGEIIEKHVMPIIKSKSKKEYDVQNIVKILGTINQIQTQGVNVILEKEHVRPISGKRASFNLGFGFGMLQGILEALEIPYEIISPQSWMKEFGIISKDEKGSIKFCQRKWPKEVWTATERCKKPHDGLTDSAVMALYCLRKNG